MTQAPRYTVSVRALCEFAAKQGDLDLRFTPSPTAQQGVAGHQSVAARRGAGHRSELSLTGEFGSLLVRGRADGYDPGLQRLEEVKTFKGDWERIPANHRRLHWAQAKVYGWLLCQQLGLARVAVALVYFDVVRQQEMPALVEDCDADSLRSHFEALCGRFVGWAELELSHRARRDRDLTALRFAHASFRAGQHTLARAAFHAARHGRVLLAQAPTGIGKTIGTLFPLLKACPEQSLDKVYFLTAKGTGRALAWDALDAIRDDQPSLALRVIELVAQDQACEHPDKVCQGDSCPLARGFYDRLPAARHAAVAVVSLDRAALRKVALAHDVCPYYLAQDVVRWCDVVIADYNHYFDASALLYSLGVSLGWRVATLVDEAHNLVERARHMYSAQLEPEPWRALRSSAPAALRRPLLRLNRAWQRLAAPATPAYAVLAAPPSAFCSALKEVCTAMGEQLANDPQGLDSAFLHCYFAALQFQRLTESFDTHSLFDVTIAPGAPLRGRARGSITPCVRNVRPAPFLAPRFAASHACVLFSATLTPLRFYSDTLGLPADTAWLDVPAPFRAEQLVVRTVRDVSTRYRDRAASLAPIAALIARQYDAQPGNYLAFFSSFEYLQQAVQMFRDHHPRIRCWEQGRRMDTDERAAFLERFEPGGHGVGFAVLGGTFGEGIDLPGTRLIGAFVATLGLPQVNPVNEALRTRLQDEFGAGYDYTYLYPGVRKVVQAAGRVIRTLTDRGTLYLIDDRYSTPAVRQLLPSWWQIESIAIRSAAAPSVTGCVEADIVAGEVVATRIQVERQR